MARRGPREREGWLRDGLGTGGCTTGDETTVPQAAQTGWVRAEPQTGQSELGFTGTHTCRG